MLAINLYQFVNMNMSHDYVQVKSQILSPRLLNNSNNTEAKSEKPLWPVTFTKNGSTDQISMFLQGSLSFG